MEGANLNLLLFDVDGTLLRSAGAGRDSMNLSFKKVFDIENGFDGIEMMGRTDPSILKEALKNNRLVWDEARVDLFRNTYFQTLEKEIERPRNGKGLCPGIQKLLQILEKRPDVVLGLLTGNWKSSAFIKLRHFSIDHYFKIGAFADDSEKRDELAPYAIKRLEEAYRVSIQSSQVYVIGDTPLDIQCARPHRVRTIAVATGFHSITELETEKPDYIFENFRHPEKLVSLFT